MLQHFLVGSFIITGMVLSFKTNRLELSASLFGGFLALIIYAGSGLLGIGLLSTFFVVGSWATSWKLSEKETRKPLVGSSVAIKRDARQVFANAGLAGLLALFALVLPAHKELFVIMLASCFSSALSDTLSSELGNIYGKNFYNILNFKADQKGLNGVVSLEGTLAGIGGSLLIALLYALFKGLDADFLIIILAGTIGNGSDSILGATLERRHTLTNNAVNFLNTLVAALASMFLVAW